MTVINEKNKPCEFMWFDEDLEEENGEIITKAIGPFCCSEQRSAEYGGGSSPCEKFNLEHHFQHSCGYEVPAVHVKMKKTTEEYRSERRVMWSELGLLAAKALASECSSRPGDPIDWPENRTALGRILGILERLTFGKEGKNDPE